MNDRGTDPIGYDAEVFERLRTHPLDGSPGQYPRPRATSADWTSRRPKPPLACCGSTGTHHAETCLFKAQERVMGATPLVEKPGIDPGDALAALSICGLSGNYGAKGEPLACAYPRGHDGDHAWASLPTFVDGSPDSLRLDPEDPESVACPRCGGPGAVAAHYGLCCDCIVPFDRECSPAGKAPSAALWGNR